MRKVAALVAGLAMALGFGFGTANADGEVGIVIQIGDEVETYCVAYEGESITGEQALVRAGFSIEQLGGGTRAVCAIGDVGCFDASSFGTCFCECQGRDCTYWGFFTREYGAGWVYSTLGFNLLQATDGDVHGWKWGAGGPSSAPAPVDVRFEQICGHTPQSLNPATPTPTQPAATPTLADAGSPTAAATASSAAGSATPARATTATVEASATAPGTVAPSVVVTIGNTPAPPDTASGDDDGGSGGGLFAAGAIGAVLLVAIGGAAVWRVRRGA